MCPCPQPPDSGCRCVEHEQGLGFTLPSRVRTLQAVQAPTVPPRTHSELLVLVLAESRKHCDACNGDAERCNAGQGAPSYDRLQGCAAWSASGRLAAQQAPEKPLQPWVPRPSRHRTAA